MKGVGDVSRRRSHKEVRRSWCNCAGGADGVFGCDGAIGVIGAKMGTLVVISACLYQNGLETLATDHTHPVAAVAAPAYVIDFEIVVVGEHW